MHSREAEIVPKDQDKRKGGYAETTIAMQRARVTAQKLTGPALMTQRAREPVQSSRRLTQGASE